MPSYFYTFKAWKQGYMAIESVEFGESASAAENYFDKHATEFDIAMLFENDHLATQPIDYTHPEEGDEPFMHFNRTESKYQIMLTDKSASPIKKIIPNLSSLPLSSFPIGTPLYYGIEFKGHCESADFSIALGDDPMPFGVALQIKDLLTGAFFTWKLSLCLDVALYCGAYDVAKVLSSEIRDQLLDLSQNNL